ncbi:MAG TPA: hypothetical protein VFM02_01200 [Candidatus Paceibacterota bacterium]|nr:hypothetical protein [Candidatus Paceibacterota bacterium]
MESLLLGFAKMAGKTLRFLFKTFLGLILVLLGGILQENWGRWEKMEGRKKILYGCFFVPSALFLRAVGPLWEKL